MVCRFERGGVDHCLEHAREGPKASEKRHGQPGRGVALLAAAGAMTLYCSDGSSEVHFIVPIDDQASSGEVYPRAPLRFVVCAAHFPLSPRLQRADAKEAVHERLAETFPLAEMIRPTPVPPPFPGGQRRPAGAPPIPEKLRMTNRERTCSVTIGPRIVLLERSDHDCFDSLSGLLGQVLEALASVTAPATISEVSLRYVNEIRHPSVRGARDWGGLLHDSLVGPVNLLDAEAQQASAAAVYRLSGGREVRIVFGAESGGFAVDPSGPLQLEPPPAGGPFFRLDIAAEWMAPGGPMRPFAVDGVLRVARDLHAPIREAFENAITDELRAHLRGADCDCAGGVAGPPREALEAGAHEFSAPPYLAPPDVLSTDAGAGAVNLRSAPDSERDEQDLRLPAVRRRLTELLREYEQLDRSGQLAAHAPVDPASRAAGPRPRPEAARSAHGDPRYTALGAVSVFSSPSSPPVGPSIKRGSRG